MAITDNRIRFSTTGIDLFAPFPLTQTEVTANTIQVEGVGVRVTNAIAPIVSGNGIQAGLTAITLQSSPSAVISDNNINMNGAGAGITVASSNETSVTSNTIAAPTVGIAIGQTEAVRVIANTVDNPAVVGIALDDDERALVDDNLVDNSVLGIHYKKGIDAVLSNNEVNSLAGGTGIRLGTGVAGCPVNVDNILVQDNLLTGGAFGVEVLCDVGTSTLIGN